MKLFPFYSIGALLLLLTATSPLGWYMAGATTTLAVFEFVDILWEIFHKED